MRTTSLIISKEGSRLWRGGRDAIDDEESEINYLEKLASIQEQLLILEQ